MEKKGFLIKLVAVVLFCAFSVIAYKQGRINNNKPTKTDFAMGTAVSIRIYDIKGVQESADTASRTIRRLDNTISWRFQNGELATINNNYEVGGKNELSEELYEAINKAYEICKDSDGALDITVRPLANLWNIENASSEDFEVPSKEDIEKAMDQVDYSCLEFTEDGKLIINKEGVVIDLGAVGKGYALDVIKKRLERDKVGGANISVGGSIMVYGTKANKKDWKIGIRNPKGNVNDYIGYISIKPNVTTFISTSGDYEKFIEKDGVIYHHILDPHTGEPAKSDYASVTIICDNGLVSDGLSTACFILGYDRSLPLLEKYNASAVFVDKNNEVKIVGDVNYTDK